jgi:acyl-CoA thioesterase-1
MKRRSFVHSLLSGSAALAAGCDLGSSGGGGSAKPVDTSTTSTASGSSTTGSGASAASSSSSSATSSPSGVVLVFGDSITRGFGVSEPYGSKLERMIKRKVVISGRDGENATGGGSSRIGGVIDKVRPAVVCILEGINDCNREKPPAGTAAALKSMVNTAKAKGVKKVIVGTVPPLTGPKAARNYLVQDLNKRIRALGVTVADIASEFSASLMDADGIHPNASGHSVIAAAFADKI